MSKITICILILAIPLLAARTNDDEKARTITIKNLKYDPPKLTIKAGETVTWINADDNDHTVTSDEKDGFGSDNLGNGDKFRHAFETKGTYKYHCKYHPRMKGVVIVAED
jgi:plastocyanin